MVFPDDNAHDHHEVNILRAISFLQSLIPVWSSDINGALHDNNSFEDSAKTGFKHISIFLCPKLWICPINWMQKIGTFLPSKICSYALIRDSPEQKVFSVISLSSLEWITVKHPDSPKMDNGERYLCIMGFSA
ncbi:hypothetical protein PoB_007336000 [Plakobranchus ocellatus]|uniref:Uncharacterized protein n=1 Tax=Plakobranchus ocellatus TaxID=259542 RepID=A0AAV4DRS7_9GAST|nr:hypothetical protein PoB_007336000 [Plakobranchus ocellatus]